MEDNYCHYYRDHSGQRATGIGLAAGLGGGALLLAIAGIWGVNKASEARSAGATQSMAGLAAALGAVNNNVASNRMAIENALASERVSREGWQNANIPTLQSYIDVQAAPTQTTNASAAALAAAISNNGLNNAIGTESFLRVARYSAPRPCGCDSCNG